MSERGAAADDASSKISVAVNVVNKRRYTLLSVYAFTYCLQTESDDKNVIWPSYTGVAFHTGYYAVTRRGALGYVFIVIVIFLRVGKA